MLKKSLGLEPGKAVGRVFEANVATTAPRSAEDVQGAKKEQAALLETVLLLSIQVWETFHMVRRTQRAGACIIQQLETAVLSAWWRCMRKCHLTGEPQPQQSIVSAILEDVLLT